MQMGAANFRPPPSYNYFRIILQKESQAQGLPANLGHKE